jgi:hypothetical protein
MAACTIVSLNYLAFARTLAQSLKRNHPDLPIYVLIVDEAGGDPDLESDAGLFQAIEVGALGIAGFRNVSFRYDILELNTNVKPSFLKHLIGLGFSKVVYFDPDIEVFSGIGFLGEELETHSILLTPHTMVPIDDGHHPSEQDHLNSGVFNLGFIAVNASAESLAFLDWWESRCLRLGYSDIRDGLFVDQKWAAFIPCYFPSAKILRHAGCNVAYWNLHERSLGSHDDRLLVNQSEPLVFFHFSGITLDCLDRISKYQDRTRLAARPDVLPLFEEYRRQLLANGHDRMKAKPYAFGRFGDGTPISALARRYFSLMEGRLTDADPFSPQGEFYRWARSKRLLSAGSDAKKFTAANYDPKDIRIRVINRLLMMSRYLLGPDRFTALMKYLSRIAILRNQSDLL